MSASTVASIAAVLAIASFVAFVAFGLISALRRDRTGAPPAIDTTDLRLQSGVTDIVKLIEAVAKLAESLGKFADSLAKAGPAISALLASLIFLSIAAALAA